MVEEGQASHLTYTLITFMFGFSSACAAFTGVKIVHQTYRVWRRSKNVFTHPYILMITAEWTSSLVISIISFLFLDGIISPSFELFFSILCLWVIQIQCIMHIIINRIALIMYDNKRVRKLKWSATLLVGAINISVFVIWMPARLEVSETWIHINDIWDRVEKGMLAVVDLGLNLYFIYLVRKELITYGLTKYRHLYRFNIGMIFISMSLDIVLIGVMSLPNQSMSTFIYVQFHPLMYLIKLNIEMNMADLIIKIVKASSPAPGHELHRYATPAPNPHPQRPSKTRDNSDNSNRSTAGASSNTALDSQAPNVPSPRSGPPATYGQQPTTLWEVTQMPRDQDVSDVVDQRKASVAEGLVVPVSTRPGLLRNMSEMTALEVRAGYMSSTNRDRRNASCVEQSPC